MTLSAPELTVLVGGMRALNANTGGTALGVLTDRPGTLSNDFFRNLLDVQWSGSGDFFEGREGGALKWSGSRADLVFGSNSQLRAIAEVYGSSDGETKFVRDFVAAWAKVMELGRFD
jgi:catalase-peroxidase